MTGTKTRYEDYAGVTPEYEEDEIICCMLCHEEFEPDELNDDGVCKICEAKDGYTEELGKQFVTENEKDFYLNFIFGSLRYDEQIQLIKDYIESKRKYAKFMKKFYQTQFGELPPWGLDSIGDIERQVKVYCTGSDATDSYIEFYHSK